MAGPPTWRDHLRAAFVLTHVVAITVMALPAPQGARTPSSWKEPTVRAELTAWSQRLGVDRAAFEDVVRSTAVGVADARDAVLAPLDPYFRYAGTWQAWRMFVAPHRFPARLQIRAKEGGRWVVLYEAGATAPSEDWRGDQLRHARMRALVFLSAWRRHARARVRLADWVAARVAEERPDATAVELRYWKARTPAPGEAATGGSWVAVETRSLP